jgi:putative ABC transport system permease protein
MFPILGIGSVLGVALADWGVKLMIPSLPTSLPRVEEIQVSAPVLLFSGCVLGLTAALVLVWPAIRATRIELVADLRDDARTASGSARKATMRDFLVVGQVAITVVLLVGAGLLIRTFSELKAVNPGFRPEGVLSLHLAIPRAKYTDDRQVAAFCQRVLERVQALPGIEHAGMVNRLPLSGQVDAWSIEFEGSAPPLIRVDNVAARTATPDYFSTMGIRLMDGRFFTERDQENAPQVAIVDDQVARTFWPGESAVGKRLRAAGRENIWTEIVGVVSHIRHDNLDTDPGPQIYWNYLQRARDRMALVVRSEASGRLARDVLDAIWSEDPEQPVYAVRPMSEVLDGSLALRWFNTVVLSAFAAASLFLAVLGIYGVVSWNAKQRTREVGIRIALGAARRDVVGMVLSHGMKLAGSGIALGLAGAAAVTRLIHSLLFGVSDIDPLTFGVVSVMLAGVALLACWLPARRASRVDPMVALRHE